MPQKIAILGAGVAGLTVAHELAHVENNQYEIHVYDRHECIGGMARSGYKHRNGINLPTEYCWRIYGPNYYNLREILKQIPIQNDANKTVHDNLVNIDEYLIADQKTVLNMNNRPSTLWKLRKAFQHVPLKEKWQVLSAIVYCFMISTKRLNALDNMTWNDFINHNDSLCHDMRKYIVDIMGPYLGADAMKVNVPSVIKTLETFKILNKPLSVMGAPTNEAWFDHWQPYLESKGVVFHLNSDITSIQSTHEKIEYIELDNNTQVSADVFFCCLSVESVAKLLAKSMPNMNQLADNAYQLMVGIQLYFDKKIQLPYRNTALYIPDSPWQLVIEPQGSIWNKAYEDVADVWSIGLCDSVRPGLLSKKPFVQCSHEEIKNDVWHQITSSELGRFLCLDDVSVIDDNVWKTYVYNGHDIETNEPKFSTNKNTYFLRPDNKTSLENVVFATGYTKTDTDMFEMESAAESGRRAAKILEPSVRVVGMRRPLLFSIYHAFDRGFGKFNLYQYSPFAFLCLGLPFMVILPFVYFHRKLQDDTCQ